MRQSGWNTVTIPEKWDRDEAWSRVECRRWRANSAKLLGAMLGAGSNRLFKKEPFRCDLFLPYEAHPEEL